MFNLRAKIYTKAKLLRASNETKFRHFRDVMCEAVKRLTLTNTYVKKRLA